jgi:hypothetical protein
MHKIHKLHTNYKYCVVHNISMQRLEFAKVTSKTNQKTEQTVEEIERRENERIRALVSSRRMYKLENSDVFYIESSKDNIFYYCKLSFTSPTTSSFCSCKDFEFRGHIRNCYHLELMIPMGIMKGKMVDVPALPKDVIRDNMIAKESLGSMDYENQRMDEVEYSY